MTEQQAIQLFKCLADPSRLQILKSLLQEDMYVERLAERLNLTPATISFHLRKLEAAGAVSSRKEQYYTMYTLRRDVFMCNILDIIREESGEKDAQEKRDEAYRQKVLDSFFEYGRLKSIPTQRKKRRICLEVIADCFEMGKNYDEKEVNEIIGRFHADYCLIRREMIAEKMFVRGNGVYTRVE